MAKLFGLLWLLLVPKLWLYGNLFTMCYLRMKIFARRGFTMVSCCSMCNQAFENAHNLFLKCPFVVKFWNYSFFCAWDAFGLTSINILVILNNRWSSQLKNLILFSITSIILIFWFCRNKIKFDNDRLNCYNILSMIKKCFVDF
jgi:hypothetical protein